MGPQTSTDYDVDNRYRGLKPASDNVEGKKFLDQYIRTDKANDRTHLTLERREDNRIIMSAPSWGQNYSFKNAFGSPVSPAERRLTRAGQ